MESAKPGKEDEAGLSPSVQVPSSNEVERRAAKRARIVACVGRAFEAMGISTTTQELIFWKLTVIKGIRRDEIVDKPAAFIIGLNEIYGEAGTKVFEFMLGREIKREFDVKTPLPEPGERGPENSSEVLRLIRYVDS